MGLKDRDYMHERRRERSPFTPPPAKRGGWFVVGVKDRTLACASRHNRRLFLSPEPFAHVQHLRF